MAVRALLHSLPSLVDCSLVENINQYLSGLLFVHGKEKDQYLGCHTTVNDFLRVLAFHGKENDVRVLGFNLNTLRDKQDFLFNDRFDKNHADIIMNIFTHWLVHPKKLSFPCSRYIPTFEQLNIHLRHHGNYLTELSLARCPCHGNKDMDPLLNIICSSTSLLRCLTLPKCGKESIYDRCCISEVGAQTIINSNLINTLQEITFSSTVFVNEDVLLKILSSLSDNLRILNMSHIAFRGCRKNERIPIPFAFLSSSSSSSSSSSFSCSFCSSSSSSYHSYRPLSQLQHLRIYDYVDCECQNDDERCLPDEDHYCPWHEIGEQYHNLKTLQISSWWARYWEPNWLLCLNEGLRRRKKPLEYLCLQKICDVDYDVIRQMNVDRINIGETLNDILYEMIRGDRDDLSIEKLSICGWSFDFDHRDQCRDMLAIINFLIPDYRHIETVFDGCCTAIIEMVKDSRLRQHLALTPSFVETFLSRIICPENNLFDLTPVFDILVVYGECISVDVFDMVLRTLSLQKPMDYYRPNLRKICWYFVNVWTKYSTDEYIVAMQRIWGPRLLQTIQYWFGVFSDLIEHFNEERLICFDDQNRKRLKV